MEGWQIRLIVRTFILYFNPEKFEFMAVDRKRK